ncbi:MAG: stress response translation initiation inhibitor YciH [Gammaproteobacteria bacterium]|nr:stress response translation initiation inhibitor YciH [Gammaproteobacteria bacterium]
MVKNSRSVYSTSSGRLCPDCEKPVANCSCKVTITNNSIGNTVYLSCERKGRAGKEVTVIKEFPGNAMVLKLMASELKSQCGSGGTVSQGNIEIQGDHRNKLRLILESKGYRVKLSGG